MGVHNCHHCGKIYALLVPAFQRLCIQCAFYVDREIKKLMGYLKRRRRLVTLEELSKRSPFSIADLQALCYEGKFGPYKYNIQLTCPRCQETKSAGEFAGHFCHACAVTVIELASLNVALHHFSPAQASLLPDVPDITLRKKEFHHKKHQKR